MERAIRRLPPDAEAWPTRCEGWTVRDVVAHLAGTFTDIRTWRIARLGTPETNRRQIVERRDADVEQLLDELAAGVEWATRRAVAFAGLSDEHGRQVSLLRRLLLVLWFDLYVHTDDILDAGGTEPDPMVASAGLWASIDHIRNVLAGRNVEIASLPDERLVEVRAGDVGVRLDARRFVLAATGRAGAAAAGLERHIAIYATALDGDGGDRGEAAS